MRSVVRDGLTFDVTAAGPPGGVPVVLLHGFPQSAACWAALTPALTARGLRTVAPDQRGYSPGARPARTTAYRLSELLADAVAVVRAAIAEAGSSAVHLVGHDWGGAVAWALAARHPELVGTVTVLSVPPRGAMRAALRWPRQLLASSYVPMFAVPGLAERLYAAPRGRQFSPAFVRLLRRSGQSRERAERDAARLADRAALTAALNWYRALPWVGREPDPPVTVPSLYIWSDRDVALTRAAAEQAERHVAGPFRYAELRGVSHWIPEEAPDAVAELLLDHIALAS